MFGETSKNKMTNGIRKMSFFQGAGSSNSGRCPDASVPTSKHDSRKNRIGKLSRDPTSTKSVQKTKFVRLVSIGRCRDYGYGMATFRGAVPPERGTKFSNFHIQTSFAHLLCFALNFGAPRQDVSRPIVASPCLPNVAFFPQKRTTGEGAQNSLDSRQREMMGGCQPVLGGDAQMGGR